jgi:hypothetical protein
MRVIGMYMPAWCETRNVLVYAPFVACCEHTVYGVAVGSVWTRS